MNWTRIFFALSHVGSWYLWQCWNCLLWSLTHPLCPSYATNPKELYEFSNSWHYVLHLITAIALKTVEEEKAEPLQEEVVIGTIWVKPCNLNSGYRSAWLYTIPVACSPALPNTVSLTSLLQCQIDAQTSGMTSSANCWDLFTDSSGASAAQCEL